MQFSVKLKIEFLNRNRILNWKRKGDNIHSHTCRRSYVTNCLDKGMKLALVSKNVGHKKKSTTLSLMGGSEQTLKHSENP